MIVRFEPWGGWVKLESTAALVALDREGLRALGLDGGAAWTGPARPSAPLEVHVAVTERCGAGCRGCYLDARPGGREPSRAEITRVLDALAEAGVFTVAFGGGEPTTRDDLGDLADDARARGFTVVVTTSGLGLSDARIGRLHAFDQVNVSYDGPGDAYADVRGFDGAAAAERAIERLARAGVRVGVNVVLTRATFDRIGDTVGRARALGASEAQLLRYKPAGRAASLEYLAARLSPAQVLRFPGVLRGLARDTGDAFRVRIDCALVPFLSTDAELCAHPDRLARFGVFGCEAGAALAAVTVEGRVAPCSFAPPTSLSPAALDGAHASDATLAPWRAAPAESGPCAECPIAAVCKGGCKVVASFVDDRVGPDPECPRVAATRGGTGRGSRDEAGARAVR